MSGSEIRPQLDEARRALLEKRRKGKTGAAPESAAPLTPRPEQAPTLASFGQERLWYLQQFAPSGTAYNMTNAVRLRGSLDMTALQRALDCVVARQQALRTTLALEDGALIQRITPDLSVSIVRADVPPGAVTGRLRELAKVPFDLERGPLIRVWLLHESDSSAVLVVSLHHCIADEWSVGLLWRELSVAYTAYTTGTEPAFPPLTYHYADAAWHQRQQMAAGQFDAPLAYWTTLLNGDLPLLQLPADHPRPPVQRGRGGFITRTLPTDLSNRVIALSKEAGTTPFNLLLAAFQVFLQRYAQQADILVGIPVTIRDHHQIEALIGFFLNTVVVRADFSQPMSFSDLLGQMRQQTVTALAHKQVPFEQVVERVRPRRDPSYAPIFQAMIVYQEATSHNLDLPGVSAEPIMLDAGVAKFDVTLFAGLERDQFTLSLEYDAALFEPTSAQRMLTCLEALLHSITQSPTTTIDRLNILPDDDRRTLLEVWTQTAMPYPDSACIHDLIAAQPSGDVALIAADGELTYGQLDARANQVAHALQALGMAASTPIGLCVERSLEMIVGMVGILKAGCAYVPIDPTYPAERRQMIIDDAGLRIVLAGRDLLTGLSASGARIIALDSSDIQDQPISTPAHTATPDSLAYMIYTSGSTGRPKGVRVTHRNVVHSTTARFTFFEEPARRFLLLSSFAFDSSVAGIFWSLCQGGALVLPPPNAERDVMQLAEIIRRHQVTHTLMLPSLYRVLLDFAGAQALRSLRVVMVAGEACPLTLVAQHYAVLPEASLVNEYGPTEGTVWCTGYHIPPDADRILIGTAIPNMQTYVLDANQQPVPIGVVGELYIGGLGIAEGYHNRPDLTAERFVANPFGAGRLYRSGDLVRYHEDGNLEFLGRVDNQVKVSGYRIELSEIEAVLTQHPAVIEAVVLLAADDSTPDLPVDEIDPVALLRALADDPDGLGILAEIEGLSESAAQALVDQIRRR